jgi:hydroxyacylglutathione hydrolase
MKIHILPALKDNYIYVLANSAGECAVIDPGESEPVRKFLAGRGLRLKHILCTHHHWDHVNGAQALADEFGADIVCSGRDLGQIGGATRAAENGELLGERMEVLEIPGHTLGQIGFWFPDMKALFAGDTLFSCGCGRLFEGTHEQMFASLAKIKALPPDTRLYFGHEYTLRNIDFVLSRGVRDEDLLNYKHESEERVRRCEPTSPGTLALELRINPFLKAATVDEFRRWREARDLY